MWHESDSDQLLQGLTVKEKKTHTTERTLTDIALACAAILSLLWLGKKMDKKFYKLVGKRHRFDYK